MVCVARILYALRSTALGGRDFFLFIAVLRAMLRVPSYDESVALLRRFEDAPALDAAEAPCAWVEHVEDGDVVLCFDPCRIISPRAQVRASHDVLHGASPARVRVDLRALTAWELWRLRRATTDEERRAGIAVWVTLPYRVARADVVLSSAFARAFARGVIATCLSAKMQARVHVE